MTGLSPCEWPITYIGEGCDALSDLSPNELQLIETMATDLLWLWTGRRFGICEQVLRPCRAEPSGRPSTFSGNGPYPSHDGFPATGSWLPLIGCGSCGGACGCDLENGTTSLSLRGPVHEITSVRINGQVLPTDAYRLQYNKYLIRTDGGHWPLIQDLTREPSELDTFEVIFTAGTPVPPGGQVAAGLLACELAKAFTYDDSCQLPKRVQTITRQGVTVGFEDDFSGLESGRPTGIWEIDSWVASVRPSSSYAGVRSPDVPKQGLRGKQWRL